MGVKVFFMSDAQDQKFKDCVRTLLPKIDSLVGSMVTINVWWRDRRKVWPKLKIRAHMLSMMLKFRLIRLRLQTSSTCTSKLAL